MDFFRQQEEQMAERLLRWQYQKKGLPIPDDAEMRRQAVRVVAEAHGIARERGRNVISILKELMRDILKR